MRRISKKRELMGEKKWAEYQKEKRKQKDIRFRKKHPEFHVNYRSNIKRKLVQYKGGKCEMCGYNKDVMSAYDFHHVGGKDFSLGNKSLSFDTAKKEVDKCKLLCRNCHAEVHEEMFNEMKQNTIQQLSETGMYRCD